MQVLTKFDIEQVVVIDEEINFEEKALHLVENWKIIAAKFLSEGLDQGRIDYLGNLTINSLETASVREREIIQENIEETEQGVNSLSWIKKEVKDCGLGYKEYSSAEEFSSYDDNKNTLFIIDQYLKENDLTPLKGILTNIRENFLDNGKINIIFIYTSSVQSLTNYEEVLTYLVDLVGLDQNEAREIALYIHFIKKKSSVISESELLVPIRKSLKAKYFSEYQKSLTGKMEEIQKSFYNTEDNQDIKHYNYLQEGIQMHEVLENVVINSVTKGFQKIGNLTDLQKKINKAMHLHYSKKSKNEIKNICKIGRYNQEQEKIKNLNSLDISPVKTHMDISFGDVFEIQKENSESLHYVVVSQSCDITIRHDGRDPEDVLLLSIKFDENKELKDNLKQYAFSKAGRSSAVEAIESFNVTEEDYKKYRLIEEEKLILINKNYNVVSLQKEKKLLRLKYSFLNFTILNEEGAIYLPSKKEITLDNVRYAQKKVIERGIEYYVDKQNVYSKHSEILQGVIEYKDFLEIPYLKCDSDGRTNYTRVGNIGKELTQNLYLEWFQSQTRPAYMFTPDIV